MLLLESFLRFLRLRAVAENETYRAVVAPHDFGENEAVVAPVTQLLCDLDAERVGYQGAQRVLAEDEGSWREARKEGAR